MGYYIQMRGDNGEWNTDQNPVTDTRKESGHGNAPIADREHAERVCRMMVAIGANRVRLVDFSGKVLKEFVPKY